MKSLKVTQIQLFVFLGVFVSALVSRFYGLTLKPIHFDEAINGWFSIQIKNLGFYKYDPNNYHGPLYFYLLRGYESLWGQSLFILRSVSATFSVLSVGLFMYPVLRSQKTSAWMMFFLLLSPAFVFFGRSGIHEMTFVFFQLVFALGMLRAVEGRQDSAAVAMILVGAFAMASLKETFTVTGFCFLIGMLFTGKERLKELFSLRRWHNIWTRRLSILVILLLFGFGILFTGSGQNLEGIVDFFRAFLPWMKTGVHGKGHEKEFWYWLETLWVAEPLVLFGMVLAFVGIFSKNAALRVVSVFSILQFLIYSIIPYKTVWCILSLVWGFYFVIAYTLQDAQNKIIKILLWLVIGTGTLYNMQSIYRSSYQQPLDYTHPYIYVNSTYQLVEVENFLKQSAQENPELLKTPIQVGMEEQWPWPWILRRYHVASYQICGKNLVEGAAVYFCDANDMIMMDTALAEPYWRVLFNFREGRQSYVYFKKSLFPKTPFAAELIGHEGE